MSKSLLPIACCLASALAACRSAEPFEGLAPAQQTGGPRIVFDLTRKPFPEVPFPNDILSRVDTSRPPPAPPPRSSHQTVLQQDEDLLEFYERSTHTLILRPVVPLRQQTRYAVLLTNRVRDPQARAVVPPGSGINHPGQTNELRPLLAHLPPGVQVSDIAYV